MKIKRLKTTFMFTTNKNKYFLQFSLKDPWIFPKKDSKFLNGKITLYGWLFIYFGYSNKKEK